MHELVTSDLPGEGKSRVTGLGEVSDAMESAGLCWQGDQGGEGGVCLPEHGIVGGDEIPGLAEKSGARVGNCCCCMVG